MYRWTLLLPLALLACASPEVRVPAPTPTPVTTVPIRAASIEVREVSLPSYAALEDIFLQGADGTLSAMGDLLWADDPTRAFTLGLSRALADVTGRTVAPEPWPFDSFPTARVDVRVEDLLVEPAGLVRLKGLAFVASLDGRGPERSLSFDLVAETGLPVTPVAVAAARSRLIGDLAVKIATDGFR